MSVAKESGQPADTIVTKNIEKMWSRLHPRSQANAVWLYNVDATDQLMGLTRDVGTGGVPVMTPAGGLSESPYSTIYARPMIPIEYAATLGDEGDLILADLSMYLIGRKGGVEFAESMHIRFDYREHVLRFVLEIDGQPAQNARIVAGRFGGAACARAMAGARSAGAARAERPRGHPRDVVALP